MHALTPQIKVSLVTGACLVGLVAALKNLVRVPAEIIARDVVLFISLYWALGLYPTPAAAAHPTGLNRPLYRGALMIVITLTIIVIYALLQA
jgi:hypothetical protein